MTVRLARMEDCARIAALAAEGAARWSRAMVVEALGGVAMEFVEKRVWVADDGGPCVGFLAGSFVVGAETASLDNVATAAGYRRRGIGRALVVEFARWAAERGAQSVELEVRSLNAVARQAYAAMGFVEVGLRPRYYVSPVEDAVLLQAAVADLRRERA